MKIMNRILKILVVAGFALSVQAQEEDTSGFAIDSSNFKTIFSESVTSVGQDIKRDSKPLDIEVQTSYVTFSDLELSNSFFKVNYAEELKSIPAVHLIGSKKYSIGSYDLEPAVGFGYGSREAYINVRSAQNVVLKDYVSLQWVPLSLGLRTSHVLFGVSSLRGFVTPSIGANYFYQSGELDGMDQGYWISYASLRAGISFLESSSNTRKSSQWFDGVVLSTSALQGLSSEVKMRAMTVDLGIRFLL